MFSIFRAVVERLKALFATSAALELEAEFVARDAERKAELLRLADHYAGEGLHGIASHLRLRAENLSVERPLAGTLPAVEHLLSAGGNAELPLLDAPTSTDSSNPKTKTVASKKKGR